MSEGKIWLSDLHLQCYRHRHWSKDISDVDGAQALQLSVMVMLVSSVIFNCNFCNIIALAMVLLSKCKVPYYTISMVGSFCNGQYLGNVK